jgi:serine phosphatase RsbU (regulator of sigma subunit)
MEKFNVGTQQVELEDADILLLYTDGITEASNLKGEQFGSDRLADVVRGHTDLTPQELANTLLTQVSDFSGNKGFVDDITVVASKVG